MAFTALGAALGFFLGRINQRLDARKSKNNFLKAIGVELRALQNHIEETKRAADEVLTDFAHGKRGVVTFTDSYEVTIFTTQFGKLADISDERILMAIGIYSDVGAAQNHQGKLSEEAAKIAQLEPGAAHDACVESYFAGLQHLSDILATVLKKIEDLLPKLPA